MRSRQTILITGCSSGIGKLSAQLLTARGHRVIATAPSAALLDACPAECALRVVLDVTDDASVVAAVKRAQAELGPITTLINNAGYCQAGPLEQLTDPQILRQFEVNVFGALRTIRAVLPSMRAHGQGRIINISSLVGLVSFPFIGLYSASKHALEGLSDALRVEVAPFGVDVVVIEPGWIRTAFAQTATDLANRNWLAAGQPYAATLNRLEARQKYMKYADGQPEQVADKVARAVELKKPSPRYRVTAVASVFPVIKLLGRERVLDRVHKLIAGMAS